MTSIEEALARFLGELRRPLTFVADQPERVSARTQIAPVFVDRGRALAERLTDGRGRLLGEICQRLERWPRASAGERREAARRCLELLERIQRGDLPAVSDVEPTRAETGPPPGYEPSAGDPRSGLELLNKPVQFVRGVGPRRAGLLARFGIMTCEDLLYHLPFRYEDRRRLSDIAALRTGEDGLVVGEITHVAERIVGRARRRILEAVVKDSTGLLALTWFNQVSYFRNKLRRGLRCRVYGRVERVPGGGKRIVHPEIELGEMEEGAGILPVYNKPTSMSVAAMRAVVQQAVRDALPHVPCVIPHELANGARITDLRRAFADVHLPQPDADLERLGAFRSVAHRSIVFDELFFLQLGLALRRRHLSRESGRRLVRRGALTERLQKSLPFALTGAQQRVIAEIEADLAAPHPMHRLVHGDVGSGKTVVALFAALIALENDLQVAFMAPTELLAEQHYRTVQALSADLGISTALLTGDAGRAERKRLYGELEEGRIQLVVGTHALIQENVRFRDLGLGIIDEQHRFGVLQRAALRDIRAAPGAPPPEILLMTATPIPRTLAMTVYGDLEVSALDELPPGRKPVETHVYRENERIRVYRLVHHELQRGHQAYIVYPLVESSEKEDLRDATTMAHELGRTVFRDHRIGLLHGRMKADEKEAVMRRFRDGELHLLVSTTVVEVGVDVPNATVMVVEHAERFGLSQLHQLRGRVGRGAERAYCFLIAPAFAVEDSYRRLKAMETTTDGFRIAELDLEIRGPGDFLGTRQSGLPDFRAANLLRDSRLLVQARDLAQQWLQHDPDLSGPQSVALRAVLAHRWAGRLGLAEVG